ncbi:unnamed protein product, partial [Ectocarpus sp. 12 AP-2014]
MSSPSNRQRTRETEMVEVALEKRSRSFPLEYWVHHRKTHRFRGKVRLPVLHRVTVGIAGARHLSAPLHRRPRVAVENLPAAAPVVVPSTTTVATMASDHHIQERWSRCLDAIAITLNQAYRGEGEHWYNSALQLQLVCLALCGACRSVPAWHLRVDDQTPESLWDPNVRISSRVPDAMALRLTWVYGRMNDFVLDSGDRQWK